ncbi:MAG: hypothetical protein D6714_14245 [Bacteroidetes bacterium]|nr:MAG: hypothetical protein D6714_14245 [Bacteroidota bacterium]
MCFQILPVFEHIIANEFGEPAEYDPKRLPASMHFDSFYMKPVFSRRKKSSLSDFGKGVGHVGSIFNFCGVKFMTILYEILKAIVRLSLRIFYSKITFENRKVAYYDHPCIVISNHPSTLMDPLNAVAWIGPQVKFLANASLFKSKAGNWFFNTFYCIPIERYQDTGGKPLNNEAAFLKAREHLHGGGTIYMAPEGGSFSRRELRPLKTGFARIAFDAAQSRNFEMDLAILPVGLNYSNPRVCRSTIFTKFGTPIYIRDFQTLYGKDPVEAVRTLRDFTYEKLSDLLICTKSPEEERLLGQLEMICQNHKPLPAPKDFERTQGLLAKLRAIEKQNPEQFEELKTTVDQYFEQLKKEGLRDKAIVQNIKPVEVLGLLLAFPFSILGLLFNFFPVAIPGWVNKKWNHEPAYDATFKYVTGLVTFPLFYGLEVSAIKAFCGVNGFWGFYFLFFYATGLCAEWFLKTGRLFLDKNRLQKKLIAQLLQTRAKIIQLMAFE